MNADRYTPDVSLRVKFGILLGVIALAVALAVGASWWAFATMQNDIRSPFRGMSIVLASLGRVKEHVETMRHDTPEPGSPAVENATLAAAHAAEAELARVAADPDELGEWSLRTGRNGLVNLRTRLLEATECVRASTRTTGGPSAEDLGRLAGVHELIERIEGRIVGETARAIRFGDALRARWLIVLAAALLLVLLTAALGVALIRRWVLLPVAQLRVAAARIAEGEFSYRIPVPESARADELARLSTEVNQMAGMVRSMQEDRVDRERLAAVGEMVRRLAHNLRNPLGGIRGLAELTRSELRDTTQPSARAIAEMRESQDRIIDSVDRFERWLNELLNVTRPAEVVPEPTDVAPWLEGLIRAHEPAAQTRGVFLQLRVEAALPKVWMDARHLEHAVSAIVSNAIDAAGSPDARKACPAPLVRVEARQQPARDKAGHPPAFQLAITDTGMGISSTLHEKIFRPYFTTKRDGNGIGLAIAQQVVRAHGGRIHVESPRIVGMDPRNAQEGPVLGSRVVGTRMTIEIPMNRPDLASASETALANSGQTGADHGQSAGD